MVIEPSLEKKLKWGSKLDIVKEPYRWEIEVLILNQQRRPAAEALLMFQESPKSLEKRLSEIVLQKEKT